MRVKVAIFLYLLSSFAWASDVKVQAFGKELAIPNDCVLFARPSVLGSLIEYWCSTEIPVSSGSVTFFQFEDLNKHSGSILKMFTKAEYEISDVQEYELGAMKVTSFKRSKPIKDYHMQACDQELCIYVMSTQKQRVLNIEHQLR